MLVGADRDAEDYCERAVNSLPNLRKGFVTIRKDDLVGWVADLLVRAHSQLKENSKTKAKVKEGSGAVVSDACVHAQAELDSNGDLTGAARMLRSD